MLLGAGTTPRPKLFQTRDSSPSAQFLSGTWVPGHLPHVYLHIRIPPARDILKWKELVRKLFWQERAYRCDLS